MSIGSLIRHRLGILEKPITNLYRRLFVDLRFLVSVIHRIVPASQILEIGCGEGAVTEHLANAYVDSEIIGIDIMPHIGRLFQGDRDRVVFKQQTLQDFAKDTQSTMDMVIISDVLHHVPWSQHKIFLTEAGRLLKPGGYLVIKEWERNNTLIHLLAYLSDRYITRDTIKFKSADEWRMDLIKIFGAESLKSEWRIKPWDNNIIFFIQI